MDTRIPPPFPTTSPFGRRTPGSGIGAGGRPSRVSRKDRIVQSTDTDALSSKYSAFKKGYLEDPYLESIVASAISQSGPNGYASNAFVSKLPVINIGMCGYLKDADV